MPGDTQAETIRPTDPGVQAPVHPGVQAPVDPGVQAPVDPVVAARRAAQQARTSAVLIDFRHELGVAYGDHPRQVMDIYYPSSLTAPAPVLVFLHGGGFRTGAPAFNGYHGRPYLERGSIFISMGYRLRPDVRFPDTAEDVELGLHWLLSEIAHRGGDPTRVYLSGHSAGAILAATVGLRPSPSLPADLIKGLVLISGMYTFGNRTEGMYNVASPRYIPALPEAIEHVPQHTIVVAGDRDLPGVLPDANALVAAIQARGGTVEMFVEPDADHFEANRGFIAPDGQVAEAVARMLQLPARAD